MTYIHTKSTWIQEQIVKIKSLCVDYQRTVLHTSTHKCCDNNKNKTIFTFAMFFLPFPLLFSTFLALSRLLSKKNVQTHVELKLKKRHYYVRTLGK